MSNSINIHFRNQYADIRKSFILSAIESVANVSVTFDQRADPDLEICGPHNEVLSCGSKLVRKVVRATGLNRIIERTPRRAKVVLYLTEENTRHSAIDADFFIGPDLGVHRENYFRMPNWWCSLDWSSQGVLNRASPRIRKLIDPQKLVEPLGSATLRRTKKAAIFSSHMIEPRESIFRQISSVIQVDGFGRAFNKQINNHNESGFFKEDILRDYMFCLCPENSMYPGYYTEKIPESFAAGCIPVGWADQNLMVDFRAGSFINLADFAYEGYAKGFSRLLESGFLEELVNTPLMDQVPSLDGLLSYLSKIVNRSLA